MSFCVIGLGSNVGERQRTLDQAVEILARHSQITLRRRSTLRQTSAAGGPSGQAPFLNAAIAIETTLSPHALLAVLLQTENSLGRQRIERWGPRTLDLDLLLFDELVLESPDLVVPHPRLAWRRFALDPAAEVAGSKVHPTIGWTLDRLRSHLQDRRNYVAIAGAAQERRVALASQIAQSTAAQWIADPATSGVSDAIFADSSVRAFEIGLKSLEERAAALSTQAALWDSPQAVWISDFWFDQCLAWASVWCPKSRLRQLEDRWSALAGRIESPKLTVLVDASTESLAGRWGSPDLAHGPVLAHDIVEQYREAVERCLRRPTVGPVMRLVDCSPRHAVDEVAAAMVAMQ